MLPTFPQPEPTHYEESPVTAVGSAWMQLGRWDVEPGRDGAVLVRVRSADRHGGRLPDAVFTFRLGDPQYLFWKQQLDQRAK